jgi:hypothetical protein
VGIDSILTGGIKVLCFIKLVYYAHAHAYAYLFFRDEERVLRKKKFVAQSVKHCCPGHNFFPFNLETSPFQVSYILVVRGAYRFSDILTNSFG